MGASTPEQVDHLISLGFPEVAGYSQHEFEMYAGRPENKKAILVVSELMVTIPIQCKLLGIDNRLEMKQLGTHENTVPLPKNKGIYWCYGIDDGRAMKGLSPEQAIQQLSDSKRFPAHTALVLAIFRMDIHLISDNHRIDIGGSRVESDFVPALLLANGRPLNEHPVLTSAKLSEKANPNYGMASFEYAK